MTSRPILLTPQREEKEIYPYRRVWRTASIEAMLLLLSAVVVIVTMRLLPLELTPTLRRIFGLGFAFFPLLLWYLFSFRAEQRALQPRERLFTGVVLGVLVASGVGMPLSERIFGAEDWLSTASGLSRIIGYTLTVGMVQESLKYAVLRYSVWPITFQTRQDGVAYAMATAVGYATALNLYFALSGDIAPDAAALRMVELTLAQVSISTIMGLALYELRNPNVLIFMVPGALLLAAALNSLSIVFRAGLIVGGVGVGSTANNALYGLGMAIFMVVFLFNAVSFLINSADQRDTERQTGRGGGVWPAQAELTRNQRWASYLTLALAVLGLLSGFLYRGSVVGATFPFINREVGISARYPARWLLEERPPQFVLRAQDPAARPYKTALQVTLLPTGSGARPADILNLLDMDRAGRLPAYRSLGRTPITLPGGQRGQQMTYAFAYVEPNPFLQAEPVTVRAVDVVVLRPGQAVVISFEAESASFDRHWHYFDDFLRALSF